MFKCNAIVLELSGAFLFLTLLGAPRAGYGSFFESGAERCGDTPWGVSKEEGVTKTVGLNDVLIGYGTYEEIFSVTLPEPGILNVELTVPGSSPAESKLALVDSVCGKDEDRSRKILRRSVSRILVAVEEPGILLLRGAAQDPLTPLGAYKLTTGFAELGPAVPAEPETLPLKEDPDPEVIEIEPEQEILGIPSDSGLRSELEELCRATEVDDHADRFLCATRILPGTEVSGTISPTRGDDEDVFELLLPPTLEPVVWTVTLETTGETDTFGGLYDHGGHRLAAADDGGTGANFRIVKALVSGSYFIRVEGGTGAYSLKVSASAW